MVRGTSIALGIGLVILWIVGLSNQATGWLTWLDGLAAIVAFGIAAAAVSDGTGAMAASPIGLSVGLFVLWIVGLTMHSETWLAWWTFAFACGFLLLGLFSGASTRRPTMAHPQRV
jgi:hypothetical protein